MSQLRSKALTFVRQNVRGLVVFGIAAIVLVTLAWSAQAAPTWDVTPEAGDELPAKFQGHMWSCEADPQLDADCNLL